MRPATFLDRHSPQLSRMRFLCCICLSLIPSALGSERDDTCAAMSDTPVIDVGYLADGRKRGQFVWYCSFRGWFYRLSASGRR